MAHNDTTTTEAALTDALSGLADLGAALNSASDAAAILAAAVAWLGRFDPQGARLYYLHDDAEAGPAQVQPVASWSSGEATAHAVALGRFPLADEALLAQCVAHGDPPLLVRDLTGQPKDQALRLCDDPAACRTLALLPLRSDAHGGWLGVLAVSFTTPREVSTAERRAYRLLMAILATHLGARRALHALAESRADAALMQEVTDQLNLAGSLDQMLQALLLPVPDRDDVEISMCRIEVGTAGEPEWCTVTNALDGEGARVNRPLGARYKLTSIPFAKLYLDNPGVPLLVGDVEADPRIDDYARKLYANAGIRSTIALALTVQTRWVGLLSISWRHPVTLTKRLQRILQTLAKPAALLLDNSIMLERVRASLKSAEEQGQLLRSVLDNIPVGVLLLEAPAGVPILTNTWLDRLVEKTKYPDRQTTSLLAQVAINEPGTDHPLAPDELISRRVMRSGKIETGEVDFVRPDGARLSAEVTAVPIFDDAGQVKQVISLLTDLSARKRAASERAQMQDEIIRVQAAALAERSSPLIPITDEILVLPLIGSIDTERGQQVLETVLHGTSERGARVTIIDITGVRTVDTQAASALTGAAQALRLLGVEPVLTGIRPEVAQTLIGLGVNLSGITTRSTLQSGIKYALKHLGKPRLS